MNSLHAMYRTFNTMDWKGRKGGGNDKVHITPVLFMEPDKLIYGCYYFLIDLLGNIQSYAIGRNKFSRALTCCDDGRLLLVVLKGDNCISQYSRISRKFFP